MTMDQRYRRRADEYMPTEQTYQNYQGNGYDNQGQPGAYGTPPTPPAAMSSTLDKVLLGSDEENSKLLDLVDKLRECRVDQFIDLPQVVAVGDQSSGKSSVLEAITSLPFPRDSIQCTRYATEIRLRRDNSRSEVTTKVSIMAYDKARDQKRYDAFGQSVEEGFNLEEVFRRANSLIFRTDSKNFLSRDILRVERIGPNLPHLTIVDLPGIIHNPTKTQTAADVDAIAELSRFYMSKERTIILPIVGCDAEYAKQVIVRRCKEADPAGIRTLGVITKPDMTLTDKREESFLDLACNRDERNRLQLGWHVLKNRAHDQMDLTTAERDAEEKKFFANSKWGTKLESSQLGVDALRKKLSTQLIRHIANEVFKVQDEIERQLDQCKLKLKDLGPGWDTPEQMRQELHTLCKRSGSLTQAAIQGHGLNPVGEDFFPRFNEGTKRYARNLRSKVVIQNENFSEGMEKRGSSCIIEGWPNNNQDNRSPSLSKSKNSGTPPIVSRKDFIEREVRPLIQDNPGQEISVDINPLLVYRLFQQYSRNWPKMADQHVAMVENLCEEFLTEVMGHSWPKKLVNRAWRDFIRQAVEERNQSAAIELEKLKMDHSRYIRTYGSSFDERYYRQRNATQGDGPPPPLNKYEDTLNKMLLHYEHKLPTFITNVITQVVERHLIDGLEEIFQGERVMKLSDLEVRRLMEEDFATQTERRELKDQRDVLQNGLDICKEISRRPDLGPYEYQESKLLDQSSPFTPKRGEQDIPSLPPRRQVQSPSRPSAPIGGVSTIGTNNDQFFSYEQPTRRSSRSSFKRSSQSSMQSPVTPAGSSNTSQRIPDPPTYDEISTHNDPVPVHVPSTEEEEEQNLQKALQMSLQDSSSPYGTSSSATPGTFPGNPTQGLQDSVARRPKSGRIQGLFGRV